MAPSNKTRIMYKSNMNFERFSRYFDDMLRKGFVEEMNGNNGRSSYKTTERGRILLKALQEAMDLMGSEGS